MQLVTAWVDYLTSVFGTDIVYYSRGSGEKLLLLSACPIICTYNCSIRSPCACNNEALLLVRCNAQEVSYCRDNRGNKQLCTPMILFACMHAHTHTHMHTLTHTHIHTHTHTQYTHAHTHTRIHTHTYTHTGSTLVGFIDSGFLLYWRMPSVSQWWRSWQSSSILAWLIHLTSSHTTSVM